MSKYMVLELDEYTKLRRECRRKAGSPSYAAHRAGREGLRVLNRMNLLEDINE